MDALPRLVSATREMADLFVQVMGSLAVRLLLNPRVHDTDSLLELISAAEDADQPLIAEHLDHAERVLAQHITCRHREGAV